MCDFDLESSIRTMDDRSFKRISAIIERNYGIKMPPEKKTLLEFRLNKRLNALNIKTFDEYFRYLFQNGGLKDEIVDLINVVSTNKTEFFREAVHFRCFTESALPEILSGYTPQYRKKIFIWSTACSSGEEPYSLAMAAEDFREKNRKAFPWFDYIILGTDISTSMLKIARHGVYNSQSIETIPFDLRCKYLLRSRESSKNLFRIIPELRSKVRFYRLNLMDENYSIDNMFDVIFCRNVMIYFRKETQEELIGKLAKLLNPYGYLFIGHSETIINMEAPFIMTAPTVYRRQDGL